MEEDWRNLIENSYADLTETIDPNKLFLARLRQYRIITGAQEEKLDVSTVFCTVFCGIINRGITQKNIQLI